MHARKWLSFNLVDGGVNILVHKGTKLKNWSVQELIKNIKN